MPRIASGNFCDDQRLLTRIKNRQWRFAWIFRMSGLMMGAVSIVLGGFTFVGAKDVRLDEEQQCWVADADIIGDGVRAGTWSQAAILFLSTLLGSFHHSHTAIKELGSGLLGMHVSLALAFLGPLVQGELSPVDAILGSMILDVQNSALSMQLMEKETLAARWQVGAVMVAQLLGLVTIGIIMHSFTQETLAVDSCKCFSAFWWSWFSNCPTGHPNQVFPFWIYYSLRYLSTAHSWFLSMSKTASYDKALRWEDDNLSRLCRSCRDRNHNDDPTSCECDTCTGSPSACKNCGRLACCSERKMRCEPCPDCKQCESCNHMSFEFEAAYMKLGFRMHSELPTTVSQPYLEHGAFACLSLVAAERTITMQSVRLTSPVYSIGQITPIVIAGLTILRVVWVTSMELHKKNR
ncbi:hypothetical protein B0J15DRAFT_596067 [Fusarium solani]|uniref:Uncharacterized protein n=1 Tax=Fusarium solani TaxID=169388 RepID=A0A9P9KFA7_FUSSL|nr:uncharacterized protein B0J15DRAFT_596067 [Fusarium solani]KAH7250784.1 hypothetical protein B0J15DRAFT_596067 [Fusarium solani]